MLLHSTKHQVEEVNFEEAVFKGLPDDNGLYMPNEWPELPATFFEQLPGMSFPEMSYRVAEKLLSEDIPAPALRELVEDMVSFDAPLHEVEPNLYSLELFHGPSNAFKDFGARFMARVMAHFLKGKNTEINILVATSGDTGGAVALGFLNTPGIKVTILYPSAMVSNLQEKQLTTLGGNIRALEVKGTFDDCQRLVKEAFLDKELNQKLNLSSANSINIARLIPQSFYYFRAWAQVAAKKLPVVFTVPSGNFGNLCGGLIAKNMGLPIEHFVAATNANDVVPEYINTGLFAPRPSVRTISNAMDVGNPSNFARLMAFYGNDREALTKDISGYSFTDDETNAAIRRVHAASGYIICPHTAVGYLGMKKYMIEHPVPVSGIFLSTAHPAKFINEMDADIAAKIELPHNLKAFLDGKKQSTKIDADFSQLKQFLLG